MKPTLSVKSILTLFMVVALGACEIKVTGAPATGDDTQADGEAARSAIDAEGQTLSPVKKACGLPVGVEFDGRDVIDATTGLPIILLSTPYPEKIPETEAALKAVIVKPASLACFMDGAGPYNCTGNYVVTFETEEAAAEYLEVCAPVEE